MMKETVDLNCDMGEGFGQWVLGDAPDEEIMQIISSANIAAGFHAGDPNSMDRVVKLAQAHGVGLGAHPGYADLQGFGRRYIKTDAAELINDIVYQIGAIREFGRRHSTPLQHVKLHGALYMEAAVNEELSQMLVDTLQTTSPDALLFCMSVSKTYAAAKRAGHPVIREFYADRDYGNSGSIVFTRQVARPDPQQIAEKCVKACKTGMVTTVEGDEIEIPFDSICFHSDTPGALAMGQAIRAGLQDAGIRIASAAEVAKAL
ncbi:5-oxoprolinase subunit PxpA [Sulfitobacter sp. KE29]|nr:lactam utilization protein LamB [Sulfitobacter sp. HI0054]MDF3419272.1 5-oxoprolinase subunit PxpA [Sulfitobacter sp. Ks38]MDF3426754.1 5-oxoprolinase subunit PxpA [Sulfitobacter sp. KE29]MDF3430335.1 5-oxoprolinase subunit PxpA [Sulfitobacter sp. S46]MDF3445107.1 5-oxoprolinase subunit PxpA [Sulfitobacter sp. KE31]MDF3549132.1 5-oxoprolinase subunit PxpA [Sulfitobacter sp. KE28]TKA86225.1 5-oxoprolinase subunit PxpA [Sulfitobacter sp. 15WGC]